MRTAAPKNTPNKDYRPLLMIIYANKLPTPGIGNFSLKTYTSLIILLYSVHQSETKVYSANQLVI